MSPFRKKDTPMDPSDALDVVRQFSQKMTVKQPDEPLTRSLAAQVELETRKEIEGDISHGDSVRKSLGVFRDQSILESEHFAGAFGEVSKLDVVCKELDASWKDVVKKLKGETPSTKIDHGKPEDNHGRPDMAQLFQLVEQARSKLDAKRDTKTGKVRAWFYKVATSVDGCSYLFDMLPTGDKYTSVLIGGVMACIKAAVEHEKIAAKISNCLEALSEHIRSLHLAFERTPKSDYIKGKIAKFYCGLFKLLVLILKEWLSGRRRRFVHSFGNTFDQRIQESFETLAELVQKVKEEYRDEFIMGMHHDLQRLGALVQASLVGHAVEAHATRFPALTTVRPPKYGNMMLPSSDPKPEEEVLDPIGQGPSLLRQACSSAYPGQQSPKEVLSETPDWTKKTIQDATNWLEQYLQTTKTADLARSSSYLSVSSGIYNRLLQWASCLTSEALWIEGPPISSAPSQNTLTSAFMLSSLRQLGIPTIAYFCTYDSRNWENFRRPQELLKLTYSLIYQVCTVLPENLEHHPEADNRPDFSSARFSRLTPHEQSLPDAIELLGDLLLAGPSMLYCIINGLQLLDKERDPPELQACVRRFIEVLGRAVRPNTTDRPRLVKIQFSTDGYSRALHDAARASWVRRERDQMESDDEPMRLRATDIQRMREI